ncbi:hypothetical protein FQN54_002641 [Arachnomyces sp. PD_36]|nr:hypothetical protein FQN54_002641 [Arachnomyces sp. PD_36]
MPHLPGYAKHWLIPRRPLPLWNRRQFPDQTSSSDEEYVPPFRRRQRAIEFEQPVPRERPNRVVKRRRVRTERMLAHVSDPERTPSPRRTRRKRQRATSPVPDDQEPGLLTLPLEPVWYRVPPPEDDTPGLILSRFYDQDLNIDKTSFLDVSRPFVDLLDHLQRESEAVKTYSTSIVGGFTMDDGPWWYEILIRPEEGEEVNPEEQWELLGDGYDYELMINKIILNPRIWSVVFRHHTQMLRYGLSARTQAIMRQRVIGKSPEDRTAVEDMIAKARSRRSDVVAKGVVVYPVEMDLS